MADIIVKHKTFGEGKYVNIYGHYIEIQFSNGLKKFMFPNAFDNNMLETDDPWLINKIRQALNAVGKQYHSPQTVLSAPSPRPNSRDVPQQSCRTACLDEDDANYCHCTFLWHRYGARGRKRRDGTQDNSQFQ